MEHKLNKSTDHGNRNRCFLNSSIANVVFYLRKTVLSELHREIKERYCELIVLNNYISSKL